MNALAIAKTVTTTVVGFASAAVVHSIISNNTSADTTANKAKIAVGSLVLGGMVGDVASRYTDATIDRMIGFVKENTQKTP